ncbi:peptidase [Buttiauxella sp. B2]|uniref:peptidase n=1 Tax=Buttiauxella sp. B2 TaxID=2587812 RepID=UPI0011228FFD|nr:peptidase [Buttiauxella sp. B2]TNV22117.1 peptidase [Buttiauxella sp. B2]
MNLFQRLMFHRLHNAEPVDGGAPAAAEPVQASADPAAQVAEPGVQDKPAEGEEKPTGEEKVPGKEGDKPVEEKPKEGDDKDKKPEGAPEKYEFKPAEGQELDETALKEFEPIARELNLNQEQAQKFVDLYASKIVPQLQQKQVEQWTKQTEQWAVDAKADKEIGGDNMTANIGLAQKAFDQFGSPELKEYLNTTGLGNHPEIIRAFMKVGKSMSEDSMVMTNNSGQRSQADILYGNK